MTAEELEKSDATAGSINVVQENPILKIDFSCANPVVVKPNSNPLITTTRHKNLTFALIVYPSLLFRLCLVRAVFPLSI
jgi:hypothetical protein